MLRYDYYAARINPEFDPATKLPGFETFERADQARRELLENLRGISSVRLKLKACRDGSPCRSAACNVCLRQFRRFWCSHLARQIHEDDIWYATSIVPPLLRFDLHELNLFNLQTYKDRLRKQLLRGLGNDRVVIGGLDISLHAPSHQWHPHFYLAVHGGSQALITNALKNYYPANLQVPVTVRTKKIGSSVIDALRVASYTFKAGFDCRFPSTDHRGNRDSDKDPLSVEHRAILAAYQHRWGIGGRLIRRGKLRSLRLLAIR